MKTRFKIFYSVSVLGFIGLTVGMYSWSAVKESIAKGPDNIIPTTLYTESYTRHEYLSGSEFDPTGTKLVFGNQLIDPEKCEIEYDFTSAGEKIVTYKYRNDKDVYVASLPVNVYFPRKVDWANAYYNFYMDELGEFHYENSTVWLDLQSGFTEFERPAAFPNIYDTVAITDVDDVTITPFKVGEEVVEDYYNVTVKSFNNQEQQFRWNANTDTPQAPSQDRILTLTNENVESQDRLVLYVQRNGNNWVAPDGTTSFDVNGTYVYTNKYGHKTNYKFYYRIEGWSSYFRSSWEGENIVDFMNQDDSMGVKINGQTFKASPADWHKAVLNLI